MKVKDIMEPIKTWLTPDMSVRQAIQVMHSTKRQHGLPVNGMIVLDGAMNLVGILSNMDILRIILPSHVFIDERHGNISWEEIREEKTLAVQSITVNRIMTEDVRVISTQDTLLRCADTLRTERLRRLPVTRSDGKVVGVIYLRDVYNALTKLLTN